MRLFHIASPGATVAIFRSDRVKSMTAHPLNNDNGPNCFNYHPGFRFSQACEGIGASVLREWTGPVMTMPENVPPPFRLACCTINGAGVASSRIEII